MRKWDKYQALKKARKQTMDIFAFAGKEVFIRNIIGQDGVWRVDKLKSILGVREGEEACSHSGIKFIKLTSVLDERDFYYVDKHGIQYLPQHDCVRDWCPKCIDFITLYDESFRRLARRLVSHSGTNDSTILAYHFPFNRKSNYVRNNNRRKLPE